MPQNLDAVAVRAWCRLALDALGRAREESAGDGVIHCFSGGVAEARAYLDLGQYLSFSGILTFKNAGNLREPSAESVMSQPRIISDRAEMKFPVAVRVLDGSKYRSPSLGPFIPHWRGSWLCITHMRTTKPPTAAPQA